MIDFTNIVLRANPSIKTNLRIAHNKNPPDKFVKRSLRLSLYAASALTILTFFLFAKQMAIVKLFFVLILVFPISFVLILAFMLQSPKAAIRKRQREIDKEVLFAGRYLLVKLESGTALVNTLIDASKSYGVSAKYFKEIVDDIDTGIPLEDALENARTYNASDKFKRILWQMVTVLKTGSEVTNVLRGTLKSIAAEQIIEIKKYSKKLNSLMLFYMIVGTVAPSLGLTMLLIISGFLNIKFESPVLFSILFFLGVIQLAFIIMVRASRPMVDL
ncbi:hypothetical protein CMO88_04600 [Candidatus Woesearchaeota archaeon]|nr:hypothetical protein [Candidatus Woesearchaeota archaeon]|tara:strand:- start:4014 stop:4835 length:822 start_codon:yes stop_codon:yes gene_type:complete